MFNTKKDEAEFYALEIISLWKNGRKDDATEKGYELFEFLVNNFESSDDYPTDLMIVIIGIHKVRLDIELSNPSYHKFDKKFRQNVTK